MINERPLVLTHSERDKWPPFLDDSFKCIFWNENVWISIKISLKIVSIKNIPALVQIIAWRRPGDKPVSEPIMVRSMTHICITRPQWVLTPTNQQLISNLHQGAFVSNQLLKKIFSEEVHLEILLYDIQVAASKSRWTYRRLPRPYFW